MRLRPATGKQDTSIGLTQLVLCSCSNCSRYAKVEPALWDRFEGAIPWFPMNYIVSNSTTLVKSSERTIFHHNHAPIFCSISPHSEIGKSWCSVWINFLVGTNIISKLIIYRPPPSSDAIKFAANNCIPRGIGREQIGKLCLHFSTEARQPPPYR